MIRKQFTFQKALSIGLMLSLASFTTSFTSAVFAQSMHTEGPRAAGELAIVGNVLLNGTPAISGATIFSDSTIKTGEGGATVYLSQNGRMGGLIEVAQNSEMTVRFSQTNVGGNLKAGSTTISAPAGVAVSVATAEGTAVSEGKTAATLTVDVTCGNTRVAALQSNAKIVSTKKTEVVAEGQQASVGQTYPSKCKHAEPPPKFNKKYIPLFFIPLIPILIPHDDPECRDIVVSGFIPCIKK